LKILFDTNVILDLLLSREPFREVAVQLVKEVELGNLKGVVSAHTVTTIDYLTAKHYDRDTAKNAIQHLLSLFQVAEVNRDVLQMALTLPFSDYEDAVLYQAGFNVGVEGVVTRNGRDFKGGDLPIYTPQELFGLLST